MLENYRGLPRPIYILFLQRIICAVGDFVYPMLTIFLSDKLGMDEKTIGFYLMVMAFTYIPAATIAGHLADRFSRKKIIVISNLAAAIVFIAAGIAPKGMITVYLVIISSFLGCFTWVAGDAMVTDFTGPENRKQSFSLIYLGINIGLSLGYILAGFMYRYSIPLLFIIDGITTIAAVILVMIFVPDSKPTKEDIQKIESSGRNKEKAIKGGILKVFIERPVLGIFMIVLYFMGFVYSQYNFIAPLQLAQMYGANNAATYFGWTMTLNTITVVIGTPLITKFFNNMSTINSLILTGITYVIGFGMLAFATGLPIFFVAVFIWTIGEILSAISCSTFMSNHSPVTHRARIASVSTIMRGISRGSAPFIMGIVLTKSNYLVAWLLVAVIAIVAIGIVFIMKKVEETTIN